MKSGVPSRARGSRRGSAREEARQPEVDDLDRALSSLARGEEDVVRLQVAVDDAFLVERRQPIGNLAEDLQRLAEGRRPARETRSPRSSPHRRSIAR